VVVVVGARARIRDWVCGPPLQSGRAFLLERQESCLPLANPNHPPQYDCVAKAQRES